MKEKPSENIVGKGENAGNQHFLLFPQYFQPIQKWMGKFLSHIFFFWSSASAFNLNIINILSYVKGLHVKREITLNRNACRLAGFLHRLQ